LEVGWRVQLRTLIATTLLCFVFANTGAFAGELVPIVLSIKLKAAKKESLLNGGQYFSAEQFQYLTSAQAEELIQIAFERVENPKLLIEKVVGAEGCVSYPKPYKAKAPGNWLELTQFAFHKRNGHWVVTGMYYGISADWQAISGDLCERTEWPWTTHQSVAVADSNGLEPEEGIFASNAGPGPYRLALRRALLEDDRYRRCQLMTLPSFEPESVVYIQKKDGETTVISRTLKRQLWGQMMAEMRNPAKDNSINLGAASRAKALDRIQVAVEVKTARIDEQSADLIMKVCERVLLGTRYPGNPTHGLDGVRYHAGHWIPGAFLAGQTWSPRPGTVARDFVDMEDFLAAYAKSPPSSREAAKESLLAKARQLLKRLTSASGG